MAKKRQRLPKERNWVVVAAIQRSGAGRHSTNEEKRRQNKDLKEIQEQMEQDDE